MFNKFLYLITCKIIIKILLITSTFVKWQEPGRDRNIESIMRLSLLSLEVTSTYSCVNFLRSTCPNQLILLVFYLKLVHSAYLMVLKLDYINSFCIDRFNVSMIIFYLKSTTCWISFYWSSSKNIYNICF